MDDIQGGTSNAPAPFLTKTYEMVDDPFTNTVVSWSHSGCSFVVWNPPEFAQDLLPKYFKHNNFSSFVRQLNTYGFRKIDPDQWEFANEEFIRGRRHFLKNIHRRKPVHSHSVLNQANITPLTESERQEYVKEIKRLKHDKSLLQIELRKHETEKQGLECQVLSLGQRLQGMECRQMQLISFLAQLMRKPGFAAILRQQGENHSKKRRLSTFDHSHGEHHADEWQNPALTKGNLDGLELIEKMDSSLKFCENFLYGAGETFGEDVHDSQPSLVIVGELSSSYADGKTWSSMSSSPDSRDIPSSPELTGCINHVDSPTTSPKPSYLRPASSRLAVTEAVKESSLELTNSTALTGANDHFWQNFLSEAPISYDIREQPEHHSELKDSIGKPSDTKPDGHGRYWWSTNHSVNLTTHMGQHCAS